MLVDQAPARGRACSRRCWGRGEKDAAARLAAEEGCTVEWERLWAIEPIPFDDGPDRGGARGGAGGHGHGIAHCRAARCTTPAEMARKVPTVMLFSSSTNGISHAKEEDTPEEHLRLAIDAFGRTARTAIERVAAG